MTSLSMMSFLQGDFGTCEARVRSHFSRLAGCNTRRSGRSPAQIINLVKFVCQLGSRDKTSF